MQSGWNGEGKAAGATGKILRNSVGRRNRDTKPVKKWCGEGLRQAALTGGKEGSIFVEPFPPLTGVGGYVPGEDSSLF